MATMKDSAGVERARPVECVIRRGEVWGLFPADSPSQYDAWYFLGRVMTEVLAELAGADVPVERE